MLNSVSFRTYLLVALLIAAFATAAEAIDVTVQHRDAAGNPYTQVTTLNPATTAIICLDIISESLPDHVAYSRQAFIIPRINDTLAVARELGMKVLILPPTPPPDGGIYADWPQWQAYYSIPYSPLPPEAGYTWPTPLSYYGVFQHMYPPGVSPTPGGYGDQIHPDIYIAPTDYVGHNNDTQGIWNFVAEFGITHILYTGVEANYCVQDRPTGMRKMRNLGLETIIIRDLTDSAMGNGIDWDAGGYPDPRCSPDNGLHKVIAQMETHWSGGPPVGGSIAASDIMVYASGNTYNYTNRIATEPGLVSYHRLDGQCQYKQTADIMRIQSAWNTENVTMGVSGALYGDDDTAAKFNGDAAIIMAPRYTTNLPTGNELVSVSSGNFTVEAWVQVDALGNRMWALSHDHGDSELDFAVGLNPDGTFRFASRNLANDINTAGALTVTADDVANNKWFHIVGVQDATNGAFELYVNGRRLAVKNSVDGSGVAVINAITIGCRDGFFDIDDSEPGEGATGALLSGGIEFWNGIIDEVAIYNVALEGNEIFEHYKIGTTGVLVSPLAGDADLDGDVDFADYQNLESRYFVGARWCDGDFNGDDLVTFADYQMLEQNFGQSLGGSPTPEPATIGLMVFGTLGTALIRHKRKVATGLNPPLPQQGQTTRWRKMAKAAAAPR